MPVLTVNTNVSASNIPKEFKKNATDIIASVLGKPASYVAVHVKPDQDISFGNETNPAALCDLMSIGAISTETNKTFSKEFCGLLESQLKISPSRVYITFNDFNKANVGFNGTTFHSLM